MKYPSEIINKKMENQDKKCKKFFKSINKDEKNIQEVGWCYTKEDAIIEFLDEWFEIMKNGKGKKNLKKI
jgi:hypothetical protein